MKFWTLSLGLALALTLRVAATQVDLDPPDVSAVGDSSLDDLRTAEGDRERINTDGTDPMADDASPAVQTATTASQRPFAMHFRAAVRTTYDDNIFVQGKNQEHDLISSVSAGISLGLGDGVERKGNFAALRYDATAFLFADHSSLDSVDHNALLEAQWTGSKLTLLSHFRFLNLTDTNNEVAARITRDVYDLGVTATYEWSDKMVLGGEVNGVLRPQASASQIDIQETTLRIWADHEVGVLTKLGLGLTVGDVSVSRGSSQRFEQLLIRGSYSLASKADATLQAGGELREVVNGVNSATSVVSLGLTYRPYELFHVAIGGYRRVDPSIVKAGTDIILTGIDVNLNYHLFRRFDLGFKGAYERSAYETVSNNTTVPRTDDYFLIRFSPSYSFTENTRLSAFFQFRTNSSSQGDRSFENRQIGLECSAGF